MPKPPLKAGQSRHRFLQEGRLELLMTRFRQLRYGIQIRYFLLRDKNSIYCGFYNFAHLLHSQSVYNTLH